MFSQFQLNIIFELGQRISLIPTKITQPSHIHANVETNFNRKQNKNITIILNIFPVEQHLGRETSKLVNIHKKRLVNIKIKTQI